MLPASSSSIVAKNIKRSRINGRILFIVRHCEHSTLIFIQLKIDEEYCFLAKSASSRYRISGGTNERRHDEIGGFSMPSVKSRIWSPFSTKNVKLPLCELRSKKMTNTLTWICHKKTIFLLWSIQNMTIQSFFHTLINFFLNCLFFLNPFCRNSLELFVQVDDGINIEIRVYGSLKRFMTVSRRTKK